jgi:hypothetical protein
LRYYEGDDEMVTNYLTLRPEVSRNSDEHDAELLNTHLHLFNFLAFSATYVESPLKGEYRKMRYVVTGKFPFGILAGNWCRGGITGPRVSEGEGRINTDTWSSDRRFGVKAGELAL